MSSDQENGTVKLQPIVQPVFPRANQILFYTGNTLTSLKLMKKTNTSITEEILETMSMMLHTIRHEGNEKQFENETYVKLLPSSEENSDQEQLTREDLKYSVKIFLRTLEPSLLAQTIDTVLQELKENFLETVLISPPNYSQHITLEEFLPVWRVVEDYINKQKILSAGVCDFMLPFFSDFCDACQHKPYADQINLSVCCTIPEDLNKYVKENNIQLLTHSDPIDVVNQSDFQSLLREYCHENDGNGWKPLSIVRYNSVITNRGIIKSKGFFLYATRDVPDN